MRPDPAPLAGPVTAAAVILDPSRPIHGLDDSKRLSPARRAQIEVEICAKSRAWAVGWADVAEIEILNILHASLLAMRRAVAALAIAPHEVLVDGNRCPDFGYPAQAIVGGDARVPAIGAASILAKQAGDRELVRLDALYPGYGLAKHKQGVPHCRPPGGSAATWALSHPSQWLRTCTRVVGVWAYLSAQEIADRSVSRAGQGGPDGRGRIGRPRSRASGGNGVRQQCPREGICSVQAKKRRDGGRRAGSYHQRRMEECKEPPGR